MDNPKIQKKEITTPILKQFPHLEEYPSDIHEWVEWYEDELFSWFYELIYELEIEKDTDD